MNYLEIKEKLEAGIALYQKSSPTKGLDWPESVKQGLHREKNFEYAVNRFRNFGSLAEYVNAWYAEMVGGIQEINPEGDDMKLVEPLMEAIKALPLKFPDEIKDRDLEVKLQPLLYGLWQYIEDHDFTFGLGDDGTDETEMDMESVYYLLLALSGPSDFNKSLVWYFPDWHIRSNYLNTHEQPAVYITLDLAIAWLRDLDKVSKANDFDPETFTTEKQDSIAIFLRDICQDNQVIIGG
jgi:hypothetical protein